MIAYITLGGILGTLARFLMQGVIQPRTGTFPLRRIHPTCRSSSRSLRPKR